LPFVTRSLDVTGFAKAHRQSIETAARHLRIQALLEMAKEAYCQAIAIGHHRDDNAETVVQRMARGTGLRGLAGIWPSRAGSGGVRIIRPLLCVTRQEVLQYLRERDLTWREDSTNADCRFRRNFLRHRLLPALQGQGTSCLVESLSDLALSTYRLYTKAILPEVDRLWPAPASGTGGENLLPDVETLRGQPPYVQIELMRQALARLGCGERDLTDLHYTRLLALIAAKTSGKAVSLPGGFTARRWGSHIRIGRQRPPLPSAPDRGPAFLEVPGQARLGHWLIEAVVLPLDGEQGRIRGNTCRYKEWLDLDGLRPPLVVRRHRPGDRFRPLGQASDKKVGRFLIDARIPREGRDEVLVVEDQERIVWLCPVRISDTVKVTEATRRVVQISVRPADVNAD
jgi:tRNA(Ile)-lysidine synthase